MDPEHNASFKGSRLGGARRWLLERMNRGGDGGGGGGGGGVGGQDAEPLPDIDEGDEAAEDDAAAFELVRTRDQAVRTESEQTPQKQEYRSLVSRHCECVWVCVCEREATTDDLWITNKNSNPRCVRGRGSASRRFTRAPEATAGT